MSEIVADVPSLIWGWDWLWGPPLIVVTVVIHVLGLSLINGGVVRFLARTEGLVRSAWRFVMVMASIAWIAAVLHAVEALVWAGAYRLLGAIPDNRSAVLYSLSALTSYGHAEVFLTGSWQLMGAIEALNGIMLFGLTTAFLFATMQRLWLAERH